MVVFVVHTRRDRRVAMSGTNPVRLSSRPVVATARAIRSSLCGGGRSMSRAGDRSLCATSPPPPTSVASITCCESRTLRSDSKHWEEVVVPGGDGDAPDVLQEAKEEQTSPPPPASVASTACWESRMLHSDDEHWEEVVVAGADADAPDALEEATEEHGVVLGVVPTDDEVRAAVASIKQVFEKAPVVDSEAADLHALALPITVHHSSGIFMNHFALGSDGSEVGLDGWTEPARLVLNSSSLLLKEHQCVLDAFRLLKEEPSVQKMVMALSTDKDVWDAVMNNKVVQEFQRSFRDAKKTNLKGSFTALAPGFMMWVLENTQAKIRELLEKILGLVNMLFQAGDKNYDISDDIVKMSFMLSVFVFIVVTIARIH